MVLTITKLRQMDPEELLLPKEVAAIYVVDPKTVTRWAAAGLLAAVKTKGGHRRFKVGVILADLDKNES